MKQIAEDIKNGQYKKLYLLYGNEAYLKKLYLSMTYIIDGFS